METKQAATSIVSVILSFLASSHHWLHMGILMLLGGSTDMMATMGAVLWIRRVMIIMTIVMIIWSAYRLYRHRCKDKKMIGMTVISVIISVGFIGYTISQFGF